MPSHFLDVIGAHSLISIENRENFVSQMKRHTNDASDRRIHALSISTTRQNTNLIRHREVSQENSFGEFPSSASIPRKRQQNICAFPSVPVGK